MAISYQKLTHLILLARFLKKISKEDFLRFYDILCSKYFPESCTIFLQEGAKRGTLCAEDLRMSCQYRWLLAPNISEQGWFFGRFSLHITHMGGFG